MQNNPLLMALQLAQAGKNPMAMLQSMLGGNPQMVQAMRMIQGKPADRLRATAENLAKERGMSLEQVAQQMGLQLPK